jgi:ATP-dependent Clp protease ATP-binding subunit ClpX
MEIGSKPLDCCSFCGKNTKEIPLLVVSEKANICNMCIGACLNVIAEEVLKPKG